MLELTVLVKSLTCSFTALLDLFFIPFMKPALNRFNSEDVQNKEKEAPSLLGLKLITGVQMKQRSKVGH